ncbi:MAG: hypothetical protein NTW25_15170 [Candidatus Kapabacteria bacterium]|nr:hypothetical protein [Candidatus Kapabacteria bacterium]
MQPVIPFYINATFQALVFLLFVYLLYNVKQIYQDTKKIPVIFGTILIMWLVTQSVLASSGFYLNDKGFPPRFVFAVLPPFLFILYLFFFKKDFLKKLDLEQLNYIHTSRVVVEVVLLWLFQIHLVPQQMTFEGTNYDLMIGITAPYITYSFYANKLSKRLYIVWNIAGVAMLLNVVIAGILSAPTAIQKFNLDQPNIGILMYPFIWLACFIVPLVFFIHFVTIWRIIKEGKNS